MTKIARLLLCTLSVAAMCALPRLAHAISFEVVPGGSSFASNDIALQGDLSATWVDTPLGPRLQFRGGSHIQPTDTPFNDIMPASTVGAGTPLQATLRGSFEIDFSGVAFDIVAGQVGSGSSPASALLWTATGAAVISGTVDVSYLLAGIPGQSFTFTYDGLLNPLLEPGGALGPYFRPTSSSVHVEPAGTQLYLPFDLAFQASVLTIEADGIPEYLLDIGSNFVADFFGDATFRYFGEVAAVATNDPPSASVPEPHTLTLLLAGLALAWRQRAARLRA